jgi:hypothetical protein
MQLSFRGDRARELSETHDSIMNIRKSSRQIHGFHKHDAHAYGAERLSIPVYFDPALSRFDPFSTDLAVVSPRCIVLALVVEPAFGRLRGLTD